MYASNSYACELVSVEKLKQDIEQAFLTKSFIEFSRKYGDSGFVELKVENEYNEEKPIETHTFKNILAMNDWFWKMHQYTGSMLIPEPVKCDKNNCSYDLPRYTLHHGAYLLGFESSRVKKCSKLKSIYIYWG